MIRPKPLIEKLIRIQESGPTRFYKTRLDRSERTHKFSDKFVNRLKDRLDGELLMTYPEPKPLYEKFSKFIEQPVDRIHFLTGSDLCIRAIYETYISEGDKVLLHRPGYAMYPVYANMFGAKQVYQEFESDLSFDYEKYIGRIDSSFRMAVLENPNGFIGAAPPFELLKQFVEKCEKEGVLAVVDEAYYFFHKKTAADWLCEFENLLIVRTFSKALGLAGVRAGYMLSRKENIDNTRKVSPMHELTGPAILVMDELLNNPDEIFKSVEDSLDELAYLKERFADYGIPTSDSVANFLAAGLGNKLSGEELSRRLLEHDILLRRPFREKHLNIWTRIGTAPKPLLDRIFVEVEQMLAGKG